MICQIEVCIKVDSDSDMSFSSESKDPCEGTKPWLVCLCWFWRSILKMFMELLVSNLRELPW